MKAIRIQPQPPNGETYTATNPAPPSAIHLEETPTPKPSQPNQLLVQIKATTIIRDNLTWPELYATPPAYLGNDFAGIVTEVHPDEHGFKPGDEVYGMASAHRGGTWAEYAVVTTEETTLKPHGLSWAEAAALPLSALTADQALFVHAELEINGSQPKRVLVTGAAGGVGMFVVAFASAAGHYVVAATGSNARNAEFVRSMGADEIVQYRKVQERGRFDVVIDTVGGEVLEACWESAVRDNGRLISVDSASWKPKKSICTWSSSEAPRRRAPTTRRLRR